MVNVMRYKWIADAEGPAQCQTRPLYYCAGLNDLCAGE